MIRCSVIIVHYNTPALLKDCLYSLAALPEAGDLEIIVVDNNSAQAQEVEEQARHIIPSLNWIANPRNMGFAAANNRGMAQARGRYFCLLNSDTIVKPGALATLCTYLETHPRVGMVGPLLRNPDGSTQQSCYRVPTLLRTLSDGLLITNLLRPLPAVDDYKNWPHDRERLVEMVIGACVMVRREAVTAVGGLDTRFFMYSEDADWCRRFTRAGWRVAFDPQAVVIHIGRGSATEDSLTAIDRAEYSWWQYFFKHYKRGGVLVWHIAALTGSTLRAVGMMRHDPPAAARHRRRIRWHLKHVLPSQVEKRAG